MLNKVITGLDGTKPESLRKMGETFSTLSLDLWYALTFLASGRLGRGNTYKIESLYN